MSNEIENNEDVIYEEAEFITLEFEDGVTEECEIICRFEYDSNSYLALLPEGKTDDVYLYGYVEEGEEIQLIDIEDDDLFDNVCKVFDEIMDAE
ncbi:MAG: DUF1292 domain-containing protein [Lachnospiraceae bacterium]